MLKSPLYQILRKPKVWNFGTQRYLGHVEEKGIGGMFEWDESVAFDKKAQYVVRICREEDPNQILVDKVPQYYGDY